MAVAPGVAGAQQSCLEANPTYTDSCGPTFVVPAWGDAGGWKDPSKYSTIQLADFNGDGKDELLARNDQGLEIYWFDTSVGQWRPQVDANGVPQSLNDFRSPLPNETLATDWTKPEYYSTIQAADIDGQPGQEILGRFSDGMRLYKYTPPGGGNDIDGGTWTRIGTGGPYSDADGYGDPPLYSTIQVGRFKQGGPAMLFARQHVSGEFNDPDAQNRPSTLTFYRWDGQWERVPDQISGSGWKGVFLWDDEICSDPSCYLTIQTSNVLPGRRAAADDIAEIMGRDKGGEDEGNGFVNVGDVLDDPRRSVGAFRAGPATQRDPAVLGFRRIPSPAAESGLPVLGGRRDRGGQRRLRGLEPVVLRDLADRGHRRPTGRRGARARQRRPAGQEMGSRSGSRI
jgi:hypothetical protein